MTRRNGQWARRVGFAERETGHGQTGLARGRPGDAGGLGWHETSRVGAGQLVRGWPTRQRRQVGSARGSPLGRGQTAAARVGAVKSRR